MSEAELASATRSPCPDARSPEHPILLAVEEAATPVAAVEDGAAAALSTGLSTPARGDGSADEPCDELGVPLSQLASDPRRYLQRRHAAAVAASSRIATERARADAAEAHAAEMRGEMRALEHELRRVRASADGAATPTVSREIEGDEGPQLPNAFGQQTGEQLVRFLKVEHSGTTHV